MNVWLYPHPIVGRKNCKRLLTSCAKRVAHEKEWNASEVSSLGIKGCLPPPPRPHFKQGCTAPGLMMYGLWHYPFIVTNMLPTKCAAASSVTLQGSCIANKFWKYIWSKADGFTSQGSLATFLFVSKCQGFTAPWDSPHAMGCNKINK